MANRQLLRWGSALHRSAARLPFGTRTARRRDDAASQGPGVGTLYIANGRLGDSLLAAAFTNRYRQWLPSPLVAVCRPEAAIVLRDHVEELLVTDLTPGTLTAVWQSLRTRRFQLALGDLHLFHGGDALSGLLDAVAAVRRFASAGYADTAAIAPSRRLPRRAQLVDVRCKPADGTDPEALHVFGDLRSYHAAMLRQLGLLGACAALPVRPELPPDLIDPGIAVRFQLQAGAYVACQPCSSQSKKDWPWSRWLELFAAVPGVRFVLLGTEAPPDQAPLPPGCPVIDLRGRTSLREAMALSASAAAFVGVDSGLAHAAALAFVPTVVVMPAASAGFFFPYPSSFERPHVHAVTAKDYAACAGCRGLCRHEPLWHSRRHGFPCIRDLGPNPVVTQLHRALAANTPSRRPEPATAGAVGTGCQPGSGSSPQAQQTRELLCRRS